MNTKFTPGPWVSDVRVGCCAVYPKSSRDEWEQGLHNDERNVFYASYKNMALDPSYSRQAEEAIANARLIACAPDMHEMLEQSKAMLENFHRNTGSLGAKAKAEEIESLLKRARGE